MCFGDNNKAAAPAPAPAYSTINWAQYTVLWSIAVFYMYV